MCDRLEIKLVELADKDGDAFSCIQKCFCGPGMFIKTELAPLSYVSIINGKTEFICQLHLKHIAETVLEIFSDVRRHLSCGSQNIQMKLLKTKWAKSVTLDIVVCNVQSVQKLKEHLSLSIKNKKDLCLSLLYKACIKCDSVVSVENTALGKLSNISCIWVKTFSNKGADDEAQIVTKETNFIIDNVLSKQRYFSEFQNSDTELGGIDDVLHELADFVYVAFQRKIADFHPPRCVLLRGSPGTGKTTIAKVVAYKCKAILVTINGPELLGSRPGETEEHLENQFQEVVLSCKEGPCILFIDEIDSLCPKTKLYEGAQERRHSLKVVQFLDKIHHLELPLVVIAATNRPMFLDPILRRPGRIDKEIFLPVPNHKQRKMILSVHTRKHPLDVVDFDHLADITNSYVGADLASLCHEAAYLAFSDKQGKNVSMRHFLEAAKKIQPSLQKGGEGFIDSTEVSWDDIGGLNDLKIQVQQVVEWPFKHPEAFQRMGLPCPKGLLLYGPPGCCKTKLVQAAAKSCNATFLSLSGAQLYSPFVGDSERMVMELFQRARSGAPSIIFLDEIDAIIGKRGDSSSQKSVQERVLSTLLNEMDGIGIRLDETTTNQSLEPENTSNVLLVAATNRPDLIDEALLRPGRIDRIIYVPVPDKEARKSILKIYTSKMPCFDVDIEYLAENTEHCSGADLENLCREAGLAALTENMGSPLVTNDHFKSSLCNLKPSLISYDENLFSRVTRKFSFGIYKK